MSSASYTKLVYIAGPFRAKPDPLNQYVQKKNIDEAADLALEVWKLGAVAVCPHLNTAPFQGALPDEVWLDGDLTLMRRCDAVLMTPRWHESEGARVERDVALEHGVPVFYTLESMGWWLSEGRAA